MTNFGSIRELILNLRPEDPLHVYRPHSTQLAANFFLKNFPGKVLYAVKTNPDQNIIKDLNRHGIKSFDVASIGEIKLVRGLFPDAELFFMHTVKSRDAIRKAYYDYGVRNFSLDSTAELQKITSETNNAKDLNLFVRLSIPNSYAELNLTEKFGVGLDIASKLVVEARKIANKLGICFHVGSQCMHPDAYRIAMRLTKQTIDEAGVKIDMIDVGGGFPSIYPGMMPPDLLQYMEAIKEEFEVISKEHKCELLCEPGRALVAESGSVIVRVEHRRGLYLYINDGTYGSLFDAGMPKFIFPVKLIRKNNINSSHLLPYSFFGPTCDSIDFMKGPFYLPDDVAEGDYIEIGQLGAYSRSLASSFNGFGFSKEIVSVSDKPLMTLYDGYHHSDEPLEKIAA